MFVEVGYEIETAVDGADALRVVDTFPDLLITDLRTPGMSGFELLVIVRERFPQLPVIAISGEYTGDSLLEGVIADASSAKGSIPSRGYVTPRNFWRSHPCGICNVFDRRTSVELGRDAGLCGQLSALENPLLLFAQLTNVCNQALQLVCAEFPFIRWHLILALHNDSQ